MRFVTYIARRYLRSRRRSRFLSRVSVTAVIGIVLGVMVLDLTLAIMNGFHEEMRRTFVENLPMVSIVTSDPSGFGDLGLVIDAIGMDEEVTGVAPFIRQEVIVTADRRRGPPRHKAAIIWGVEPDLVDTVQPLSRLLLPGSRLAALREPGMPRVILGSDLATSLYAAMGDTIVVTAPSGELDLDNLEAESRRFVVGGFFSTGMYEFDSRFGYIDIAGAREFFGYAPQGATLVGVKVRDMMRAPQVGERLESFLGSSFHATDWIALNHNLFQWIKLEKVVMFLLLGLIVVVAAFNIVGILTMMVGERRREIGILLSMGTQRSQIQGIFMLNGFWLGLVGVAIGSLLGWLGTVYLDKVGIGLPGDVYFLDHIPVIARWEDFVTVAAVALLITLLATLMPAREAANLRPMDIIRYT
jgi:lipoprotein-releasing system permease protein